MAATVGEALAPLLLADLPLAALVGARIAPSKPTQEPAGDYLCYWNVGGGDGVALDGPTQYRWQEVRFEAVAGTQARAEAILAALRAVLHGWRDVSEGIQGAFAQGDADEQTLDDGRQISGQSYSIRFKPV